MASQRISIALLMTAAAGVRVEKQAPETALLQMDDKRAPSAPVGAVEQPVAEAAAALVPSDEAVQTYLEKMQNGTIDPDLRSTVEDQRESLAPELKTAVEAAMEAEFVRQEAQLGAEMLGFNRVDELKSAIIRQIERDDFKDIMVEQTIPENPILSAEIDALVAARQAEGDVFHILATNMCKAPGAKDWNEELQKKIQDYGQRTVDAVLDPQFAPAEHRENLCIKYQDHEKDARDRGYLAAQPIYTLGSNGERYVDGFEPLLRTRDGTHNAPGLVFREGGYQTNAIKNNDPSWARMQIEWGLAMIDQLSQNGERRVNFISVNFRLGELRMKEVQRLVIDATEKAATKGIKFIFEITEYDEAKESDTELIEMLLAHGVQLAFDDLLPGKRQIAGIRAEVVAKKFGRYHQPEIPEHATTYAQGQMWQKAFKDGLSVGTHKSCCKHSQRLLKKNLQTYNIFAPKAAPKGDWTVKAEEAVLPDGPFTMVKKEELEDATANNVFVTEYLQYIHDTLETAFAKKTLVEEAKTSGKEAELQGLNRFILEVSVDKATVEQNAWLKEIIQAAEKKNITLFSTQGGPSADRALPFDAFYCRPDEGLPTLA